ncbi:MAG: helix-turn-helix domain-containing protein, partial [Actinomycetales bacterium]|nr:helix-turn-helix domain-containing protein [Actinomycetales bacterium]
APGLARFTAILKWPTIDGSEATTAIDVVVPTSRQHGTHQGDYAIGMVLRHGMTLDEAVALSPQQPSRKQLSTLASSWLSAHGVRRRGLRLALLDCPLPHTKAVAYALMTGSPLPDGTDPRFADLIRDAYLAPGASSFPLVGWARDATAPRTVLNALAWLAARGRDLADPVPATELARMTGLPAASILAMTRQRSHGDPRILRLPSPGLRAVTPAACPDCGQWLLHVVLTPETARHDGLVCTACQALPGGPPLPEEYLDHWTGPRPPHRLTATPGARIADPRETAPRPPAPGARHLVGIGAVATALNLSPSHVRALADRGEIPYERTGPGQDRLFDLPLVLRTYQPPQQRPEALPHAAPPPGYLTLAQAAARLGTSPSTIYSIARHGGPDGGELPYRRIASGAIIVNADDLPGIDPHRLAQPSAQWLTVDQAVQRAGIGLTAIRSAIDRNELPAALIRNRWHGITPADLDEWLAGPGRHHQGLTLRQAAQRAGLTIATIRTLAYTGQLPCLRTPGGHYRITPEELDAWIAQRSDGSPCLGSPVPATPCEADPCDVERKQD